LKVVKGYFLPDDDFEFTSYFEKFDHYQKQQRDYSYQFLEKFALAIDIGANFGLWAKDLSLKFNQTICFEPNYKCIPYLVKNTDANKTIIHQVALGDKNEIQHLFSPKALGTSSFINKTRIGFTKSGEKIWGAFNESIEKIETEVKRLDDFNLVKVDYIKIDVQGFEENVLKGATNTLRNNNAVLCIENDVKDNQFSINNFLTELGYKFCGKIGKEHIFKKK
tara:strand:+ start:756 stop:1421 length:666 start_codon:yes stop_codon:yes gene_type:complete